jgi:hypothetical integral membrane protein (TIGR02206 family)
MLPYDTIQIFSSTWWISIAAVIVVITSLLLMPKYFTWAKHHYFPKTIAIFIILNILIENSYAYSLGIWKLQENLPLHLCSITGMLAALTLFRYHASIVQLVYYWGLTAGIYSLLTPEFDLGIKGYFFYAYYINHAAMIFASLYTIIYNGFEPKRNSWLKTFLFTQLVAIAIGCINLIFGSNYMYLTSPPIANNPLIIGSWPWYIIIFEILAIFHFYFLYRTFHKISSFSVKRI